MKKRQAASRTTALKRLETDQEFVVDLWAVVAGPLGLGESGRAM